MKPVWKDDRLTVQLHKPDEAILSKAMEIGAALTAMNQDTGPPLVEAISAILPPPVVDSTETPEPKKPEKAKPEQSA